MEVRQLLNPTETQIDQVTKILLDSNGTNPFIVAATGHDPSIMHDNFRARVEVGCQDGWVYVTGPSGGPYTGAVYINGIGYGFGDSAVVPGGPPKFRERVRDDIRTWLQGIFVPWFTDHMNRAFGPAGVKTSIYVNLLGVDPEQQGKGYGKALMDHLVAMADESKVAMTLITQTRRNVDWYAQFGFEVALQEEVDVLGKTHPTWALIRPAPV